MRAQIRLNFYCDWVVHSKLDRSSIAKEILREFDKAHPLLKGEMNLPPTTRQRTHSTLPLLAELGGKDRAKTVPPEPDRLVAHLDPALVEKVLNMA